MPTPAETKTAKPSSIPEGGNANCGAHRPFLQRAIRHYEHMISIAPSADVDARCGTHWLGRLDPEGRTELMAALLSRFNHDLRTPLNTILGWTHLLQKAASIRCVKSTWPT